LLVDGGPPAIGVSGEDGRLLGYITTENIGEIMMVNAARPPRTAPPRPPVNPWA
jgi:stage IV sporulation protein FB